MTREVVLNIPENLADLLQEMAADKNRSEQDMIMEVLDEQAKRHILEKMRRAFDKACESIFKASSRALLENIFAKEKYETKIYKNQISMEIPFGEGNILGFRITYFLEYSLMRISLDMWAMDSHDVQEYSEAMDENEVRDVHYIGAFPGRDFYLYVEEKLSRQDIQALRTGNLTEKLDRMFDAALRL